MILSSRSWCATLSLLTMLPIIFLCCFIHQFIPLRCS
nr:MAG TPA: hypothetical protein [Caudoviricetes sp.]